MLLFLISVNIGLQDIIYEGLYVCLMFFFNFLTIKQHNGNFAHIDGLLIFFPKTIRCPHRKMFHYYPPWNTE